MNGISAMDRYRELCASIVALNIAIDYSGDFNDYTTSSMLQTVRTDLEKELEELSKKLSEVEL